MNIAIKFLFKFIIIKLNNLFKLKKFFDKIMKKDFCFDSDCN